MKARSTGRTSLGSVGADEFEIGRIGVDDAAARVGNQDPFDVAIDHRLDERARTLPARNTQHAGSERERQEHADHGEDRK